MAAHHTSFMFEWKYNISQASHMNVVAESLIRSCHKAFNAASNYRTRAYTRNDWKTIVAEANYLLNSRPLFPKSVDDLDEEPFTGNTLLYPHGQPSIPQPQMIEPLDPEYPINPFNLSLNNFARHGFATCHHIYFFEINGSGHGKM